MKEDNREAAQDIVQKLGDLFPQSPEYNPPVKMYSYDRPLSYFWGGVIEGMLEHGWSEEEIVTWLQSKAPRWSFDGGWSEETRNLGYKLGLTAEKMEDNYAKK